VTTLRGASWLVTDRFGGDSQGAFAFNNLALHVGDDPQRVRGNRDRLAGRLGAQALVFATAAHSDQVGYVDAGGPDVPGVDALITDRPGIAVAAQGADCVMVGVSTGDWVAAVHCGWRGLVAGIVPATLAALRARGAGLAGARARLGPSICPACYTVDANRAGQIREACPEAVSGRAVDLRAGVLAQLAGAGVDATADPRCTAQDPGLYSYRRDGRTGRQALAIMREVA
jgi:hypothetical protein